MTRTEELAALRAVSVPAALDDTVKRAQKRARRRRNLLSLPAATLAGLAAAFVVMVNTSVPFALACARAPLLRQIVSAVVSEPGLKAALAHEYYQILDGEYTDNGVTFKTYCVTADDQRLTLWCSLSEGWASPVDVKSGDGSALSWAGSSLMGKPNELQYTSFSFAHGGIPQELFFVYKVYPRKDAPGADEAPARQEDNRPEQEEDKPIAEIRFSIKLDARFQTASRTVELGKPFELDGQRLRVERLVLTPTSSQLELSDGASNTAYLVGLSFYLEDEKGNRYKNAVNGISAIGGEDGTPFYPYYRLESAYFAHAEHLTLHITGAQWLDKEERTVRFDLSSGTAEGLPGFVRKWWMETEGEEHILHFHTDSDVPGIFLRPVQGSGIEMNGGGASTRGDGDGELKSQYLILEGVEGDTLEMELEMTRVEEYDLALELY